MYIDLKLQSYNGFNGDIKWHLGRKMENQNKIKLYNATSKASLKYASEMCMLSIVDERKL